MIEIIKDIQRKLRNHREVYISNEEAVKQHIILPILSSLGWKIDDPEEVRPEEKTSEGRADYALIKDGKVVAFIEAKNLSVNPAKAVQQLAKYCFDMGVEVGIVSNGRVWLIVKAFEPGKEAKDRVITTIDIVEEPPERIIVKLSCLKKDRIEKAIEICEVLNSLDNNVKRLKAFGISEGDVANYILTISIRRAYPPEISHPSDKITGVYIFHEGKWRYLPIPHGTLKDALMALMSYLSEYEDEEERKIIKRAIAEISMRNISGEKIIALIKAIEKEKNIKVLIAL
ncbi:type I restriction endonuclease [Pyrococcus abyssi]|nr:type I restriction endonuclease [Pyrococcus abyssi]